jgi:hypothetical protein
VFGSNFERDISYSDCGFSWFSQPFKANTGIVPWLGHDSFLPNRFHFTIRKSSYHSTKFIAWYTDRVLKRATNCPCVSETDFLWCTARLMILYLMKYKGKDYMCRSQWPRGLRHELSSLARTLGSWVRNPLKAWMSVCAFIMCLCCPLCRWRPCDGLITRPRSLTVCVKKIKELKKRPGPNKRF